MDSRVQDNNKMATAPLGKLMAELAVPTVFAQLVNLLYNMVDRIYVGRIPEVGHLALAGLGVTFPVIILISAFAALVGAGGAPQAAICMGKKDLKGAERILGNCITALCILAVVLSVFFYVVKEPLLMLFGASEQTIGYANSYLGIYLLGTISVQIALGLNTFINCQGFAKTGMKTVLIGAVLNIILDPIFIFGFGLGIEGAAIATALSMCISSVLVIRHFRSPSNILKLQSKCFSPRFPILVSIVGIGMAAFIMNITTGMVNIIMNRYLENNGGDYAIGAYGIISSYSIQVSMLLMGICQGMQSVIGYFYAAGHRQMTLHILRKAIRTGSLIACCGFIIGEAFAPWLVKAFTSDPTLLQLSEEGLRYTFLAMPLLGFQLIVTSYFQSIRQAPKAITMNISRQFLFLIPALGLFSHWWGLTGIWLAIPFADLMATLIALFFLWRTDRKAD